MLFFCIWHCIFQKPFFHETTQIRIGKNHVKKKVQKFSIRLTFWKIRFFFATRVPKIGMEKKRWERHQKEERKEILILGLYKKQYYIGVI